MVTMEGKDKTTVLSGARFHYREYGDPGSPPMLFLHGITATAVDYDALLRELASQWLVLALDQRGHGQTDVADDYSWERWVEDIDGVATTLGLDSFDLVGHSMGANNALRYSGTHLSQVRHLVLLEGGFGRPNAPDAAAYWGKMAQLFRPEGFESGVEFVELFAALFPRSDRAILEETAARLARRSDGFWGWPHQADPRIFPALTTTPPPSEKPFRAAVKCPVLVAQAEYSEIFVGDHFRDMAAEFEKGEARILPGTGHMIMCEAVPSTAQLIREFAAV